MAEFFFLFIAGLIVLILGADWLVRGASRLAAAFGVPPLAIGLTIVAIGTASPEIAVSMRAALNGQGDLTLGNVLGSNIFNILFILGITALVAPIVIAEQLIRKDAPIMLGVSLLAFALAFDGNIGAWDGFVLLVLLVVYTVFALRQSRGESKAIQNEYAEEFAQKEPTTAKNIAVNIFYIIAGLGLLVFGSNWLVDSAVVIAKSLGVSELIIGLTIVAVGTSLPEAATSVIAALKKESDIAVGNAVGSNIFNLLGVLGAGAVFAPDGISVTTRVLSFDFVVMVFVALVTLPIFYIDNRVSRVEGRLLLAYYALYLSHVVLDASRSSLVPAFNLFLLVFAPVMFVALVVVAVRSAKRRTG
ncbi:MAG: calcium/sodium antiporter [Chloroflexi bacterium]|nr:calcium/sodium antiporter [Chloroflexota bacterium]